MIRYAYINNQVLKVYCTIPKIEFPLDVKEIVKFLPNCKYMSYQQFAYLNRCSIDDVVQICESKSGATHYDVSSGRYLILCNQSTDENNNIGRQRWTCSHEIGHILCNHHVISAYDKLSEDGLLQNSNPEYEAEADYFAATLLSPFPLFKPLGIKSVTDVQNIFGLSSTAAIYRYKQYLKWKNDHRKTSWENDMVHIYNYKTCEF